VSAFLVHHHRKNAQTTAVTKLIRISDLVDSDAPDLNQPVQLQKAIKLRRHVRRETSYSAPTAVPSTVLTDTSDYSSDSSCPELYRGVKRFLHSSLLPFTSDGWFAKGVMGLLEIRLDRSGYCQGDMLRILVRIAPVGPCQLDASHTVFVAVRATLKCKVEHPGEPDDAQTLAVQGEAFVKRQVVMDQSNVIELRQRAPAVVDLSLPSSMRPTDTDNPVLRTSYKLHLSVQVKDKSNGFLRHVLPMLFKTAAEFKVPVIIGTFASCRVDGAESAPRYVGLGADGLPMYDHAQ
jgi:hypothetical protein